MEVEAKYYVQEAQALSINIGKYNNLIIEEEVRMRGRRLVLIIPVFSVPRYIFRKLYPVWGFVSSLGWMSVVVGGCRWWGKSMKSLIIRPRE